MNILQASEFILCCNLFDSYQTGMLWLIGMKCDLHEHESLVTGWASYIYLQIYLLIVPIWQYLTGCV
jgi:hypothetical protein